MKKLCILMLTTVLMLWYSSPLFAKNYTMIFWYPGEAGSTAEAQPILDTFFDYINGKLQGDRLGGKYFNTIPEGLAYIKEKKPDFAITSWITLEEKKSVLPAFTRLAFTLPLPKGMPEEEFAIVGYKACEGCKWNPPENFTILSSIPMEPAFLKKYLAPGIKENVTLKTTQTLLMTLKKIAADGETNKVALLTPMEKYTLDNLKSEWTGNLTALYKCRPIPSAPLVYFKSRPAISGKFLGILLKMPDDPEGAEILEELRLKGFKQMHHLGSGTK